MEFIEDIIAKELEELKNDGGCSHTIRKTGSLKKEKKLFEALEIGCECVIFVRMRPPLDPVDFVLRICKDLKYGSQVKKSRYAQRLTPVTCTMTANMDGIKNLSRKILEPIFYHSQIIQTFAIRPTLRNHSTLTRDDIIINIADFIISAPIVSTVETTKAGIVYLKDTEVQKNDQNLKHCVDLKNYEKMVLVECFKSSLGMAVVGPEFEKEYYRFNLEQIFTNKPPISMTTQPSTSTNLVD